MPTIVDVIVGNHHNVEDPCRDGVVAARAEVLLVRLVGLNRGDGHPEKIAHAMTASVANTANTTMTMSRTVFRCSRNGLKPTA